MVGPLLNIKKPSTSDDDGTPSKSCVADIQRVFRLIEDERHLIANALYQDVMSRIGKGLGPPPTKRKLRLRKSKSMAEREERAKDITEVEALISSKQDVVDDLVVSIR